MSVHESIMKDEIGSGLGGLASAGLRDSQRVSRGSQLSQRSIITNPIEKPISLNGTAKAHKG